jgi:glycosyltransferase involved in cell wall biosynthesis
VTPSGIASPGDPSGWATVRPALLAVAKAVFPDTYGGISRGAFEIANRLSQRGFQTSVLHLRKRGSLVSPLWRFTSQPYTRGKIVRFLPGDLSLAVSSFLKYVRTSQSVGPHVVLSFHLLAGLLCSVLAKRRGTLVISFFAAPGFLDWLSEKARTGSARLSFLAEAALRMKLAIGSRILRFLEHLALQNSSHILAISDYSYSTIDQYFPDVIAKARVCHWGVDTNTFRPVKDEEERQRCRNEFGISPRTKAIVCVRRLVPRMGVDLLIEAFSLLSTELEDTVLLIAGGGTMRQELEQLVSRLDCSGRAKFLGMVTGEMLPLVYRAVDVCVVPSLELEGLGLVTLESLACGTPVLGTSVGGTREILCQVDSRCLVQGFDPQALTAGMLEILTLPEPERELLIRRGLEVVTKLFTWDVVVREIEAHVSEVRL